MNKTQKHLIEYIIRDVVCFISKEHDVPVDIAMEKFFNSPIFEKLQDIETGLYTESASYVYELYKETAIMRNSTETIGNLKILALSCCCVDFFPEKNVINVGGNALNVAVSCVKTGKADVSLMGNIGNDKYAEEIIKTVDKYKINRQKLYMVNGVTANNKIYLTANGEKYEKADSWTNGVYVDFRLTDEDVEYMKTFEAVASTFNDPNFKHTLEIRSNAKFLLSIDFLEHTPKDEWENYFSSIDLFFISGKDEYLPLLKKWSEKYNTLFVSTLGANGSVAYKNGIEYSCEAVKVEKVVDTTGCGDSYQGAFIVDYLANGNILSAMKAGSQSAAITLSHVGAF